MGRAKARPYKTRKEKGTGLKTRHYRLELAGGEIAQGLKAGAEIALRQAAFAEELAQEILGKQLLLPGVAVYAARNQVAIRIASEPGARYDVIQAAPAAVSPPQAVKTQATFARVNGLAQGIGAEEVHPVPIDAIGKFFIFPVSASGADLTWQPHLY